MNIYRRYFRVESGPLVEAVNQSIKVNKEAHEKYLVLLEEVGATDQYYQVDGRLTAMQFREDPDTKLFKRVPRCSGGWFPKLNSKKAKNIAEKFKEVKTISERGCLSSVGMGGFLKMLDSGQGYRDTMVVIPSDPVVVFVSVPWFDVDPEKMKAYKKDKSRTTTNMEAVLWKPTKGMVEVKHWEFERAVDEWNESIKGE